jgi:hypothetical protein
MTFRPLNRTELRAPAPVNQSVSYAAPLVLLTAIVVAPFIPVDLPNPRAAARPAIQYEQGSSPSFLLTGAKPFLNSDQPNPRGPARLTPLQWEVSTNLSLTVQPAPFHLTDFPNPRAASRLTPLQFELSSFPAFIAPPFYQTDYPNPRGPLRGITQFELQSLPSYLITGAKPFLNSDQPLPRGARPLPLQWEYSISIPLSTAPSPFYQTDYPNPRGPLRLTPLQFEFASSPSFLLTGTKPFLLSDQPLPRGARPPPLQWEWPTALSLTTINTEPFYQTDYPNPRGPLRLTPLQFEFSSSPSFLLTGAKPFLLSDYPNPRGYTRNPQFELASTPFLLTSVKPFLQSDYPNPRGPARLTPLQWEVPPSLPLNVISLPFSLTEWPVPRGPARLTPLQFESSTALVLPKLYPPFYQTEWPVPKGYVPSIDLRTWIDSLNLPIAVPPGPMPFSQLDFPNPRAVLRGNQSFEYFIIPFVTPVPPTPPAQPIPPGFGAQKVISVDTVQNIYPVLFSNRMFIPILPSIVNVGDSFVLLVDVGQQLNVKIAYELILIKPDGSEWFAVAPQLYVGDIDVFVKQGLFPAFTYTVLQIPGSFVDQHGYWTCYLQAINGSASPIGQFYIGPPTVLT